MSLVGIIRERPWIFKLERDPFNSLRAAAYGRSRQWILHLWPLRIAMQEILHCAAVESYLSEKVVGIRST